MHGDAASGACADASGCQHDMATALAKTPSSGVLRMYDLLPLIPAGQQTTCWSVGHRGHSCSLLTQQLPDRLFATINYDVVTAIILLMY